MTRMMLLLACGALAAGCGGGSNAADEFLGRWIIESTSTQTLSCPTRMPQEFPLWLDQVLLEPGVLTDLVESAGICPFAFDITGKVASVPAEDPYRAGAPQCVVTLTNGGTLTIQPALDPPLSFNLLQPMAKMAPRAQLIGSGQANAEIPGAQPEMCTFSVHVDVYKYSKL